MSCYNVCATCKFVWLNRSYYNDNFLIRTQSKSTIQKRMYNICYGENSSYMTYIYIYYKLMSSTINQVMHLRQLFYNFRQTSIWTFRVRQQEKKEWKRWRHLLCRFHCSKTVDIAVENVMRCCSVLLTWNSSVQMNVATKSVICRNLLAVFVIVVLFNVIVSADGEWMEYIYIYFLE